jgi:hypothetical protein
MDSASQLQGLTARHAPYLAEALRSAAARAHRLHADAVSIEHLVGVCVMDEDSAASQALVHAFADPETVDLEVMALSPGLMVVGSEAAIPFSPGSVQALRAARTRAALEGAAAVETDHILHAAADTLNEEARASLANGGYLPAVVASQGTAKVIDDGPLFRSFSDPAKRALSLARKATHQVRGTDIGPARLISGCLAADSGLAKRTGLTITRATEGLRPFATDTTPLAGDPPPLDAELVAWLHELPDGTDTLGVLAHCHDPRTPELAALLKRHQVSADLLERSRGVFHDPS